MSDTEDLLLEASEELLWSGSPRLSAAIPAFVGGFALVVTGGAMLGGVQDVGSVGRAVGALLVLAGVLTPVYGVLDVRRTTYAVSDRALYARSGILSRRVRRMGLDRVQNSAYSQSVTGGIFGYGTASFESAGGEAAVQFVRIEDPREVRALVDRRVALAADPVPGTVEQWEAVLDEVRALRRVVDTHVGRLRT
ncbi:PH domain-containing protein [Salinirubellus salinus]|uniref:PH domain-containing protein n=1 Tax=Salinirubellus salinus TaxID=1364945 RepID=A0A9E7R4G7_9EURY|nr:PH domain-containing protein [Salinirubellus salinus]UWM55387.1 PH domain-containing protein [Salinirubellus salinus]